MKPILSKSGAAVLLASLALALVSCGRRGGLEPPPGAAASNPAITGTPGDYETPANPGDLPGQNTVNSSAAAPAQAGAKQAAPRPPKPFLLDPLL